LTRYAYFNDRPLYGQRTGVGHYLDLVRAHWPGDPKIELRGLNETLVGGRMSHPSDPFEFPELSSMSPVELQPLNKKSFPSGSAHSGMLKRSLRLGYEFVSKRGIKRASSKADFGVYFEPNHLPGASVHPCIATIHDLSVLELPQFHPAHRVDWWKRRMERAMGTTDKFVCVSRSTADAMLRVLGCDQQRLQVIPLASRWGAPPASWSPDSARAQLAVPERYLLHVGTIEPRKNIVRLLDAYATLSNAERERTKLILCGRVGWGDSAFWSELESHPMGEEALCTGYCSDAQVAALMLGSQGVLCPSHYEGFGLPTIEAMTLGVGAAISEAPSLVEITAGTVESVDAADTDGWARQMVRLAESLDSDAIAAAQEQASRYSWNSTAQAHHDLFNTLAH
jgi:glycosyltransferase involved in cell wall biosynthesis